MKRAFLIVATIFLSFTLTSLRCIAEDATRSFGSWVWETQQFVMQNGETVSYFATHGGTDITTINDDQFGQQWLFVGDPATGYIIKSWSTVGGVYTESGWNYVPNKTLPTNHFYDLSQQNIRYNTIIVAKAIKLNISSFDNTLSINDAQLYNVDTKQFIPLTFQNSSFDITNAKPGRYQIMARSQKGLLIQNYVIEAK